jgi:hypothetical protein
MMFRFPAFIGQTIEVDSGPYSVQSGSLLSKDATAMKGSL